MASKITTVASGDKYISVDAPNVIWVVSQPLNVIHSIPHARLIQEGTKNRMITISVSALQDTSLYKKVHTASSSD